MNSEQGSIWADRLFVLPLFVISFLVQADHLVMVPLSAEIARSTGLSLASTGLLVSIYPMAAALSAFILAPFSDRFGRKKMLLWLIVGFSLASLGCALANSVSSIFIFRILSGVFGGIIIPNALAFVGDTFDGQKKIRALTSLTLSFPIASVLGVPLGAWIGDAFSWRVPFVAIAFAAMLCVIFVFRLQGRDGIRDQGVGKQYLELLALWRQPEIRLIFAIQFLMLIGLFGFVPQLSVWLTLNFGMTTTEIGLCYMQGGVGAILGNFVARHLLQRQYLGSLISIGSLIMGVTLLGVTMELIAPFLVGVVFAITMFGGSLRMPALQVMLSDLVSVELRGRLLSMSMIVANVSMGLGGLWCLPLLSIESGRLLGMAEIGWVSFISLCFVPPLVHRLRIYLLVPASNNPRS